MLSLTVRHGLGDGLRVVRKGLSKAYRGLINGKPWKRFCAKFGIAHQVRSVEVTHGDHGWHPHLHVLFFLEATLTDDEQEEASRWLRNRWERCVRRALGVDFVPNEHGVDLRDARRADYLAKLSLELADPGTKRGRGKNRTPLQIAVSAASGRSPSDEELWIAYCAGMRGANMLTWSRGLRTKLGLDDEKSDQEIVNVDEPEPESVAVIPGRVWDRVRDRRGLACAILEAAELAPGQTEGFAAIEGLIQIGTSRAPRDGP